MGSAVPVIGLGLQAVSSLGGGGGTQYSPDPRAKYEADLMMLQQAEQNARQQEELLRQQTSVANQMVDYQREQQYWQAQNERELYQSQIQSEYNNALYQTQAQRNQLTLGQNAGSIQSQLQRNMQNAQYNTTMRNLDTTRRMNEITYGYNQVGRGIQRSDALANSEGQRAQNQLANENLTLQQLANGAARQGLRLDSSGLQLQGQMNNQAFSEGTQALDTAAARSNMNRSMARGQAELGRQGNMNQLLQTFYGNEEKANELAARMGALGIGEGTQIAGLAQDMNLDPRIAAQQSLMRNQYGQQMAGADIENMMTQGQVRAGRDNLGNQQHLKNMGLGLQNIGLIQKGAGLDRDAYGLELQRKGLGIQDQLRQYGQDSFMNNLNLQEQQDYLNRVLLPNMQYAMGSKDAQYENIANMGNMDVNDMVRNQNYRMNDQALRMSDQASGAQYGRGNQILEADLARQIHSMNAAQRSGKVANDNQLAGALAQLASSQYGLLSSVGAGLANPQPSGGGGFNLGSLAQTLGGLFQGAAQSGLLSGIGGGTKSQGMGGYSLNPAYSYGATPSFNPSAYDYSNIGIFNQNKGVPGGF